MTGRLFLIDGHALIFKMYYALLRRPMVNSKGTDTSILFGFTKYLLELIWREKPTHLAVAFDPPGGTFRNEMFPEYKANRPPTPQPVIDALEPLQRICRAMNIPVLMVKGYEADDVIGTVAKRSAAQGLTVYMVTPDKDYGQLVSPGIFQIRPGKGGGDDEVLDEAAICAKYGIPGTSQVIDMLTICGDTADNVPGVKGVGEVGASKLIMKYGSVDGIYEHLSELTARQQAMFEEARGHLDLSRRLVTIDTDVPVETGDMSVAEEYEHDILEIIDYYELPSLKKYISKVKPAPEGQSAAIEEKPAGPAMPELNRVEPSVLVMKALAAGRCSIIVDSVPNGLFSAAPSITAACLDSGRCLWSDGPVDAFRMLLEDASVEKCGMDLKRQINVLEACGIRLGGHLVDIELMHYLLNPERSHDLDVLAKSYLGIVLDRPVEPKPLMSLFDEDPMDDDGAACDQSLRCAAVLMLADKISGEMREASLMELYNTVEEPLIAVLARMERTGVRVDPASLMEFAGHLHVRMNEVEAQVREMAGDPSLNVGSPKQIGTLIFEKMKLDPKAKKNSKGSWSTDEETLTVLSDKNPIIDAILEYRAVRKLLSTYVEPFPGYISPETGRIHTTFNQALTSTGRLSSSNPNLQNIPIRTELGKEIRKAFVPGLPGAKILSADYSQIELRIMAHLSGDEHLIEAFRSGIDVHAATAAKIFGIPVGEVTPDQRRIAKTANFGIMYGISAFGLAQRLKIGRGEAKKVIEDYFASFPAISTFIKKTLENARRDGYVTTIFGRRRYVPDLTSRNGTVRALAERNAVNAPIQGSSADIIKLAMIAIDRRMRAEDMKSLMVLQIHDELLFEVPEEEMERMRKIVIEEMEGVASLAVPLTVECNYGENWLESH